MTDHDSDCEILDNIIEAHMPARRRRRMGDNTAARAITPENDSIIAEELFNSSCIWGFWNYVFKIQKRFDLSPAQAHQVRGYIEYFEDSMTWEWQISKLDIENAHPITFRKLIRYIDTCREDNGPINLPHEWGITDNMCIHTIGVFFDEYTNYLTTGANRYEHYDKSEGKFLGFTF